MSDILTTPLNEMTPMDPDVLACPHAFNERLRREAPVYQCPHTGITFVSDYDTITRIAKDHETFSNRFSTAMPTGESKVDPRVLDVWYFDIPTGAIRWYQIALCDGGRALVWTSFSGSGEPDQADPIEGTWEGSGLTVTVSYEDPSVDGGPVSAEFEYEPDDDYLMTVSVDGGSLWDGLTGVRLAPLSSVVYRLSCD